VLRTTIVRLGATTAVALAVGLAVLGSLGARPGSPAPPDPTAPRPNIIFVLTDDIGWGDFQVYNAAGKVPTPNLDRMAREGMRFTDAHTPAALCAPTRYTVATGNYTWRGRLPAGTWGWNTPAQFLPGQKTVGHILTEAGYRTSLFGKLHYGGGWEKKADGSVDFSKPMTEGPKQWGFDYSYVLLGGHQGPPYCYIENNAVVGDGSKVQQLPAGPLNGGMINGAGPGLPDWNSRTVGLTLLDKTVGFIDDTLAKDRAAGTHTPFYVHLSTPGAHGPYTPPDDLHGEPVKGVTKMSPKTDMAYEIDVIVGQLRKALAERGILKDTLIVVTSDNGGIPADRDEFGHDAVGGLRGKKSEIWEGGHRVPFLVQWGDGTAEGSKVPPGTVRNQLLGTFDIVPTFAALAGAKPGPDQMLDSVSFADVFTGKQGDDHPARATLLVQSSPGRGAFSEGRIDLASFEKLRPEEYAKAVAKAEGRTGQVAKKKQAAKKAANTDQAKAALKAARKADAKAPQRIAGRFVDELPSHAMAHAVLDGQWKLVLGIDDQPAALYDLKADLKETTNLIGDAAQADRVKQLEARYREIRSSKRSTPPLGG
jgi:arylsulfatase A-like enzyme